MCKSHAQINKANEVSDLKVLIVSIHFMTSQFDVFVKQQSTIRFNIIGY